MPKTSFDIESQLFAAPVIANNFTFLRIIVFKFNEISQWNAQSREVSYVLKGIGCSKIAIFFLCLL